MRLVSYQSDSGPRVAGVRADGYVDLNRTDPTLPPSLKTLLATGAAGLARAAAAVASGTAFDPATVRLLAPVPDPEKVICIGLNYADHARESGMAPPNEPVVFSKFPTAVCAHGDPIVLPEDSREVDYEAELVVVIGRRARRVSRAAALDYVAGYCPGHDVSARDWQLRKPGGQWLLGKSFDTFAPFGPALVTPDEAGDPNRLHIQLRLNGVTMQDSSTAQFIFGVDELVAYVSRVCTLLPGDVIFTGTPPGVGAARKPPVFMKPGDVAEVEIENLGLLRNPVVAEKTS
jgi:2-keto-4-pentenoate hydratase/2-oxohepta-3-ene-1,7-dioic acid hydratase in catechol pathway